MCIKPFYFQIRTSQNIIQKAELLSAALCFYRNPLFPIRVDILKYVLAQATDWCAGFLVRIWWRYLMVRFAGPVKCRVKFWIEQKEEKAVSLPCAPCYHTALPYRSLLPYNLTEYLDLAPKGLFCHMCRRSLRKKFCHLQHADAWVVVKILIIMIII